MYIYKLAEQMTNVYFSQGVLLHRGKWNPHSYAAGVHAQHHTTVVHLFSAGKNTPRPIYYNLLVRKVGCTLAYNY